MNPRYMLKAGGTGTECSHLRGEPGRACSFRSGDSTFRKRKAGRPGRAADESVFAVSGHGSQSSTSGAGGQVVSLRRCPFVSVRIRLRVFISPRSLDPSRRRRHSPRWPRCPPAAHGHALRGGRADLGRDEVVRGVMSGVPLAPHSTRDLSTIPDMAPALVGSSLSHGRAQRIDSSPLAGTGKQVAHSLHSTRVDSTTGG